MKVKKTIIFGEDALAIFKLKKQLPPFTEELMLSYNDPKRDQVSGVIQDLNGNDMDSLSGYIVEIVKL